VKFPSLNIPDEVALLLLNNSPCAIGVSGGKDSSALAIALNHHLDLIGHPRQNRVLVHSNLGSIEWKDSLPWCQKLSQFLELPLLVVERPAGGLIERWETRWKNNWNRYLNLECLKVILPWSTASMRFCTSELKTDIICRHLKARFSNEIIVSASGVRSEESSNRAKAPVFKLQPKLQRGKIQGFDWAPLKDWSLQDVLKLHETTGFPLHPAYIEFGSARVSCSFCMLSTVNDHSAALKQEENHQTYIRLCELELTSAFSFQTNRWLCDLDPTLREKLIPGSRVRLSHAKSIAARRCDLEAMLPRNALFIAGKPWPPNKISLRDGVIIAGIRNEILSLYGIDSKSTGRQIMKSINARVEIQEKT
jgi:3'-phosphoadenosine 5'-phosphosulfate sulfotransferase (PAPS reductase)/FAD synthetase